MENRAHRLDPLLNPGSIALVGASARPDSPGRTLAELVIGSGYRGAVYPVNPRHQKILDVPCAPDIASLPRSVDHAVLAVSNEHLEDALRQAIEHGVKAVTIFSSCTLQNDTEPSLKQRISDLAKTAGIPVCGGNSMGFYSVSYGLFAGIFPISKKVQSGSISYIAQSGSALSALVHNGTRLGFNLCVSCGNELATSAADYMDWSLEQESTRVIALFLETIRDPAGFVKALKKAYERRIPVVVLKVGKSPLGAKQAITHTGAIAGNHTALEAIFSKYGVMEVGGFDEMAALLMLLQCARKPGPGKLAAILESGGFMEMITDMCHDLSIDFAQISQPTKDEIAKHLDPGLNADNPLDAWGTNENFEYRFYACISALMKDPAVASGMFFSSFRDGYYLAEAFFRAVKKVSEEIHKPLAMVNCYSDVSHARLCTKAFEADIPFIDGAKEALLATRHLYRYRDRSTLAPEPQKQEIVFDEEIIARWRKMLGGWNDRYLMEPAAVGMLDDFGIEVPRYFPANSLEHALDRAQKIGYPVVLKSRAKGLCHKSESDGVVVDIQNSEQLTRSYRNMSKRHGTEVLVCEQIAAGIEIGFGMVNDPQFGPFIMISAGGIQIELLADRAVTFPPVSYKKVEEMISSLKVDKLLRGERGQPYRNRLALINSVVKLSCLSVLLQDYIGEMDVNPIIVNSQRAVAVDALVLLKEQKA